VNRREAYIHRRLEDMRAEAALLPKGSRERGNAVEIAAYLTDLAACTDADELRDHYEMLVAFFSTEYPPGPARDRLLEALARALRLLEGER